MSKALKIRKIGGSLGVTMPKALLDELGVGEGDSLFPVRMKDGVQLSAYDPEFETQMDVARKVMKKRRAALRELAK
jgi:putative addiction module antidote